MPGHFHLFAVALVLLTFTAPASAAEAVKPAPEICDITGRVSELKKLTKSALADGTPTALGVVSEVHVSVAVEARAPHEAGRDKTLCTHVAQATYKLCSPTPIQAGDRIRGTEGLMVVNPDGLGCLFDVAVLPKT